MKSTKQRIPEFDEIVFANRNREYGAYRLRKGYKAVTSLSVIIAAILTIAVVVGASLKPAEAKAAERKPGDIIIIIDQVIPDVIVPEPEKMPEGLERAITNLKPVVTDDTTNLTGYIPTADDLTQIPDPGVGDTVLKYVDPIDPVVDVEPEPAIVVEEMPIFPGGETELLKYVSENLNYPQEAIDNNIQGRVILKFVVKSDGSVDRIEVVRGVDKLLEAEAIRVISTLPKFTPGKQRGVPVPVWFTIPVTFRIKN